MRAKVGDGGATVRKLNNIDACIVRERRVAAATHMHKFQHKKRATKADRDEIAAYLAREPARRDY